MVHIKKLIIKLCIWGIINYKTAEYLIRKLKLKDV